MDVFDLRRNLVDSYANYIRSFIQIRDTRIEAKVREELNSGLLWPEPLIQLNPSFEPGRTIDELVDEGVLHPTCRDVFRIKKSDTNFSGHTLRLHLHQEEAIRVAPRRQLRPHDRNRLGQEPRVHDSDRRPRLAPGSAPRHLGDRGLSDERACQQPVRRAREVPAPRLSRQAGPRPIRDLHRPGREGPERSNHRQPARHPAHQLCDARARF